MLLALFMNLVLLRPAVLLDARAVVKALETHYHRVSTLKAIFLERYSDSNGGIVVESGAVYFSKPGRMRWEYESPEEKLFLVDGANVWFYVPADHTVSRAKFKESSDWRTPLALLAGKADLSRFCRNIVILSGAAAIPEERPNAAGNTVLRCTPRYDSVQAGGDIRDVLLEADPESRLARVVVREAGNLETEFRFGNWEENPAIPEAKFHFSPPPGVAVVDEATLAGALH